MPVTRIAGQGLGIDLEEDVVLKIKKYGFYRVRSILGIEGNSGYWHVGRGSREKGKGITVWAIKPAPPFTNHFEYMFIEAGETDTYYIVNRRSGLPLYVRGNADRVPLTQDRYRAASDAEYRFIVSQVNGSTGSTFRIKSYPNGNRLLVDNADPKNGKGIFSYAELPEELKHDQFELEWVEDGLAPEQREDGGALYSTRGFPRVKSLDDEVGLSTEARLLAEEVVPFLSVNDPGLTPYRQVECSPFYTLRHSLRWDKTRDRLLDGLTKHESQETTTVGMTQMDAASVSSTFSWEVEVTAEAGYEGPGFSASMSVSSKLAGEVAKTRQHSTEKRTDRSFTETITYPGLGHEYRVVTWAVVDVYELCRADKQTIFRWSATREGEEATHLFDPIPTPKKSR